MRLLQYHCARRAEMSPAAWTLETTVRFDDEVVGCQSISTKDYLAIRTGETGSWLAMKHHGRGIGTVMRQALCASTQPTPTVTLEREPASEATLEPAPF